MKKKDKTKLFVVAFLFLAIHVQAQVETNSFLISNYRHDISLSISGTDQQAIVLSDYGEIQTNLTSEMNSIRYIYQGHEYDQNLEVYFFPSRMYSSKPKRFFQPDPISQYFSSYLFVGADPINIMDKDGNEGRPLFLYQDKVDETDGELLQGFKDFAQASNAHTYSLSDFMEDKIPFDLPEWNGNVFIGAHMDTQEGIEIIAQKTKNQGELLARSSAVRWKSEGDGWFSSNIGARKMGTRLREFSDLRKIPIKSVVAGGCQGGVAAKRMSEGFEQDVLPGAPNNAIFSGLKEGKYGAVSSKANGLRFHSTKSPDFHDIYELPEEERPAGVSYKWVTEYKDGTTGWSPYAEGEEGITDLVNGRIPKTLSRDMVRYLKPYY